MRNGSVIEIIPTCVPHDPRDLSTRSSAIQAFSEKIHVDIDDGIFTAALTWPYTSAGSFSEVSLASLAGMDSEMHLMVKDPSSIGVAFARAGAGRVIGHIEAFKSADEARTTLELWRKSGALEVGLAILVDTPLSDLKTLYSACDVVQVMSVASIGLQGAPFDPRAIDRIAELRSWHPHLTISVDGGVSEATISDLVRAGATRFGVGSAIMKDPDPTAAYERILSLGTIAVQ